MGDRAKVAAGLLLLAAIGYAVWLLVTTLLSYAASLNSEVAVAIIAAAATVCVSVVSIVLGKLYEWRAQVQREIRDKKIPVYEDLLSFFFRILGGIRTGERVTEDEMAKFAIDINQRLMVWGSDDVVQAFVRWRKLGANEEEMKADPLRYMLHLEDLITSIRRDLGHKNAGFSKGDILSIFINDVDQIGSTDDRGAAN